MTLFQQPQINWGSGFSILFLLPSFQYAQRKIRTTADAEAAAVAFNGLYRTRVSFIIGYEYVVCAQFNTNAAAFAPLVKNIKRYLRILAFLLFFGVFDFGFF